MVLTEEEFLEWKRQDVTKEFFKALKNHREVMKEDHISGLYENPEFAQGKAAILKELIEMNYSEMQEILHDK